MQTSDIKAAVGIFDLMDKLHIDYPFRGTGQMHCPFHDDTNASARVYDDTNKIYCWVCGKAWDTIQLCVDYTSMNFQETLKWLEKEFEIDPSKNNLAKFYMLGAKGRDVGDVKSLVADKVISFYSSIDKDSFIWERINHCWDMFEKLNMNDAVVAKKWLSYSLATIRDAFCVSFELNRYKTQEEAV